jgi:hypothetical protein
VDPGASKGLIGSQTLHDLMKHVVEPAQMQHLVKFTKSNATFTSISSTKEKSMGKVQLPIGLHGVPRAFYHADVIGGDASGCPALLPLRSLVASKAVMIFGYFSNGDGLMGLKAKNDMFMPQRLLLTDSGHYILPIHYFRHQPLSKRLMSELQLAQHNLPRKLPEALQDQNIGVNLPSAEISDNAFVMPVFH